jgi:hypothetical protein
MNDFVNGLQNASDYINRTTIDVPTGITADLNSGTILTSTTGFNLKEVICSLLAGNGIKLPNLQLCLKINIGRLLNVDGLLAPLRNALIAAEAALDAFIAHTNIDNILNRLNAAIAEFAAIANMINFCGTPVIPRAIPNVLRDAMGSFLGAGKDILDKLGTMLDQDVGFCIGADGKFNPSIFTSGLLRDIGDYMDDFTSMPQNVLDRIVNDLYAFSNDIQNLIEFENNFSGAEKNGGSSFASSTTRIHTGVGVAIDPGAMTFAESQRIASNIKGLYDSLSSYEVDDQGRNIFDYLLEPELIDKLKNDDDPLVSLEEKEPVYDHCGRIIGYTVTDRQPPVTNSSGAPAEPVIQPATTGLTESGTVVTSPPSVTTNLSNTNTVVKTNVPLAPVGISGDRKGDIRTDGSYIYIANRDYDGVTQIWSRAPLSVW